MVAMTQEVETGWNETRSPNVGLDGVYFTRFDCYETEGELIFRCRMPDVQLIQVETCLRNGELMVQGKVLYEPGAGASRSPSKPLCFYHSFPVLHEVVVDRLSSNFKDGVLTIRLPKVGVAQTHLKLSN
jgi:HSP20 family molecular chaperone IbpA